LLRIALVEKEDIVLLRFLRDIWAYWLPVDEEDFGYLYQYAAAYFLLHICVLSLNWFEQLHRQLRAFSSVFFIFFLLQHLLNAIKLTVMKAGPFERIF
jgi:hypothetical protein